LKEAGTLLPKKREYTVGKGRGKGPSSPSNRLKNEKKGRFGVRKKKKGTARA